MSEEAIKQVHELVDAVYRTESRQVLATLIRLLGDFDAAEEALHDALCQRGRSREEGARDLLGREAAHFAQRHGYLGFRR